MKERKGGKYGVRKEGNSSFVRTSKKTTRVQRKGLRGGKKISQKKEKAELGCFLAIGKEKARSMAGRERGTSHRLQKGKRVPSDDPD